MWSFFADLTNAIDAIFRMENKMGAIADQLTDVQKKMDKAKAEILDKIASGGLDDADRAALDRIRATAQEFDDIVPDAPVEEPEQPADITPEPAGPSTPLQAGPEPTAEA